jgi:hypothetical protein
MTPEELLIEIKRHIYHGNKFNPIIQKWDLDIFIKRYGVTPYLMYEILQHDPVVKSTKQGEQIKFSRKKLNLKKPTEE